MFLIFFLQKTDSFFYIFNHYYSNIQSKVYKKNSFDRINEYLYFQSRLIYIYGMDSKPQKYIRQTVGSLREKTLYQGSTKKGDGFSGKKNNKKGIFCTIDILHKLNFIMNQGCILKSLQKYINCFK